MGQPGNTLPSVSIEVERSSLVVFANKTPHSTRSRHLDSITQRARSTVAHSREPSLDRFVFDPRGSFSDRCLIQPTQILQVVCRARRNREPNRALVNVRSAVLWRCGTMAMTRVAQRLRRESVVILATMAIRECRSFALFYHRLYLRLFVSSISKIY